MNPSIDTFLIVLLSSILIAAAIIDVRVRKIPNLLTYPTMVTALAYHFAMNGLDGLIFSAEGMALGIGIFILPYLMGGMGAGDAKLMGVVGAVMGPRGVFVASLATALVGGIMALALMLIHYKYGKGFILRSAATLKTLVVTGKYIPIPTGSDEPKPTLCYGLAIAIGALSYLFLELSQNSFVF